jgi:hypothetical protein
MEDTFALYLRIDIDVDAQSPQKSHTLFTLTQCAVALAYQ